MNQQFKLLYYFALMGLIFSGCEQAPKASNLAGVYKGTLFGVHETINLKSDGQYTQLLLMPTGQKFQTNGQWSLHYKAIELEGYLCFYSLGIPKQLVTPPQQVMMIRYVWNEHKLLNDWDIASYSLKQEMSK